MANELTVNEPRAPEIVDVSASLLLIKQVTALGTADECRSMKAAWLALRAKQKEIVDYFEPRKAESRKLWQRDLNDEKTRLDPVEKGIARAAELISAFETAEVRRQLAEAAQQAVEQKRRDEEAVVAQAVILHQAGEELDSPELLYEAQVLIENGAASPAVAVKSETAVEGMKMVEVYEFEIVDFEAVIKAVAAAPMHKVVLAINESGMNTYAEMYKERLSTLLPGVRVTKKLVPRKKGGRRK